MNFSLILYFFGFLYLTAIHLQLSYSNKNESKYFQFSNQKGPPLAETRNFATLKSGDVGQLSSGKFTMCGSIYINFFRGSQTFYTVRRNRQETLWFSLNIYNQDTTEEVYTSWVKYFNGAVSSNTGGNLRLRPHAWSHSCTTFDVESGYVRVVINGILTHNTTINSEDFTGKRPTVFRNNIVLGTYQTKGPGLPNKNWQSEASVTNVNVFSVAMNLSQQVDVTTTGRWTDGDVVSWSETEWTLSGSAETLFYKQPTIPHLFKMGEGFENVAECLNVCPRIQAGGRLPLTPSLSEAEKLNQMFYHPDNKDVFWAPFRYQTKGNFIDQYTGIVIPSNLWTADEPNGGLKESCTAWPGYNLRGSLWDVPCLYSTRKLQCLCQFIQNPILRLQGLCKGSTIDTHFSLESLKNNVIFMGLTGTVIRFLPTTSEWRLDVSMENTKGVTSTDENLLILGKYDWRIEGESAKCSKVMPSKLQLKMSSCNRDGEFTCNDGQCVTMIQRCDQIPNCKDKSDEKACKMLVIEEGYNQAVPPFTIRSTDSSIVPVQLNILIDLLKIVDMEETSHKIDFQFKISLEWKENDRVVFHNLKQDTSLNAMSSKDIASLWLPLVIYDNTDQKEVTRLGEYGNGEWNTPVSVIREGNFTRSGLEVVDETEIFKGEENTLFMQQVYTLQFQCKYNLQDYPFETQVR